MSEVCSLANAAAIKSLGRRMKVIGNCREWQRAALREPGSSARLRETQRLQEESERRLQALRKEREIREELVRAETEKQRQQMSPIKRALIDHVKKYPLYYGALRVASDPLFQCGAGLRKQRKPSSYRAKLDLEGKKKRRKERFALISDARAKAAKMPDGEEKRVILKAADDFTRNIDAAEKAVLSRDAYHHTDNKISVEGAPTGYLRGSDNPGILKRYGISRHLLAPAKSKIRAEFYIPDPAIFGVDAKPILVFKGTDPSCMGDWKADIYQATGKTSKYYEQAINLGKILKHNTGGKLELAGHSLGGGMASATGAVTGCSTIVFNPAGLHRKTISPYNKEITTDTSTISAFVVEGEVLNSGQDAAHSLGTTMVKAAAKSRLTLLSPVRLVPLAAGLELSSIPTQVGTRVNLPAVSGSTAPDIVTRHFMDTVLTSIEQEKKKDHMTLKHFLKSEGG